MKTHAGYTILIENERVAIAYNKNISDYVCWRVSNGSYYSGIYSQDIEDILTVFNERIRSC